MIEYEEIRDRLETLKHQLAYIDNSLSQNELRLQMSIKRTQMTQKAAGRLTEKFQEISRDLEETEAGIKNAQKQWLKAKQSSEK